MQDIQAMVDNWLTNGDPIAIATVTKTWGSAPRREGAKLAVTPDLAMTGSVSGGCVEGAVIEEALEGLKTESSKLLSFGVADDTAWEVGLTCGGSINVFVEPLDLTWWQLIKDRTAQDLLTTTITVLEEELSGEKVLFDETSAILYQTDNLSNEQLDSLQQIASDTRRSGQVDWDGVQVMVDVSNPRPHLIIIGGVHIAIPLQLFARTMGFRVSIIDPRRAFASEERFPDVQTISHEYPTKALEKIGLDRDTYLVVLTHDPKIDDQALLSALPANIPYIGVLSSSKTHAKRTARLKEQGMTDELLEQIYTPIGLNIGGRDPETIALAIMAQIIAVRNGVKVAV